MSNKWDKDEVVQRFREYLRIPSVQPDVDYNDCVTFLKKQAELIGLPVVVHELVPKKPIVVMTWEGLEPDQPSILLNSHMDVVPVYEEHWTHPPFEAVITEDGFIYARGTQDMKGVAMLHLEAVRRLKEAGVRLKRTVHISFVPDEEIGSKHGMEVFAVSEQFKRLNVGFELDESCPNAQPNEFLAFYGEKTSRQITVTCKGRPGHGSMMLAERTAGEKGGVQVNVLPESLSVSFDIRIACDVDCNEFENMITTWCKEAGEDVTFEYLYKNPESKSTNISSLPFWDVLQKVVNDMGFTVKPVICPGATDARLIRQQGIPAISLTPFANCPLLAHADNERLHVDTFKKGIEIMEKIVEAVANV